MDKLYKDNKSSLRDPKLLKELILAYLKKDNQKMLVQQIIKLGWFN